MLYRTEVFMNQGTQVWTYLPEKIKSIPVECFFIQFSKDGYKVQKKISHYN